MLGSEFCCDQSGIYMNSLDNLTISRFFLMNVLADNKKIL